MDNAGSTADKGALVVGGSRGIGRACAEELAVRGSRVAITYRTNPHPSLFSIQCDGGDQKSVDAAIAAASQEVGPIGILIINAAQFEQDRAIRFDDERVTALFEANVFPAFRFITRLARPMIRARWGRIVLVSSIASSRGFGGATIYSATKGALDGASRSLARDLGPYGITVNVVRPGLIETDLTQDQPEWHSTALETAPLRRCGTPAEVAAAVAFLASEHASYVTGTALAVDGGLGMGA